SCSANPTRHLGPDAVHRHSIQIVGGNPMRRVELHFTPSFIPPLPATIGDTSNDIFPRAGMG
ncbi:hypothetical protein, partial [Coxiella burnetii]|uniref:hypothetical protein n=1 Tax=Coxiella burnetii TaxID=777 RepID=UPI0039B6FFCF